MPESTEMIDLMERARTLSGKYENVIISRNNNHVLRMSRMTEPYFWHFHPNSDETFIGLDGALILELENQRVELGPGQVFTVLKVECPGNFVPVVMIETGLMKGLEIQYRLEG